MLACYMLSSPTPAIMAVVVGVLLFGRKFADFGRSLRMGVREFKKGLVGIEDDDPNWLIFNASAIPADRKYAAFAERKLTFFG